jgi:general secretion pathway protein E
VWRAMIARPHGIVLVTGPTGSGKTTTLYTTLKQLAVPEVNVCTVEDPIEMVVPELNQMQVQPAIELTFAQGIRTLLRQDPDIIMVGEIRDLETAQMAVQAALTGHLVLSTLHTNDAVSAVTRLLDLGVPYYLIQNVLIGVMAQRLVRTLCPHCKTSRPNRRRAVGGAGSTLAAAETRHHRRAARLPGMPQYRLSGAGRFVRAADGDAGTAPAVAVRHGRGARAARAFEQGMHPLRVSAALRSPPDLTTFEEVVQILPPWTEMSNACSLLIRSHCILTKLLRIVHNSFA